MAAMAGETPPPVSLRRVAKELGVRRIEFAPLWSNAGLRKVRDGYEIVLNTESPGVNENPGEQLVMDSEAPTDVQPPVRFTIAHELAHMVSLKIAGDTKRDVFVKNAEAVENACNILARILLMPPKAVLKATAGHRLELENLRGLVSAFGVSAEVFIRRLHLSDLQGCFAGTDGLLALVEMKDGAFSVEACHIFGLANALARFDEALPARGEHGQQHRSLSPRYRNSAWKLEGRRLAELQLGIDIDSLLTERKSGTVHLEVQWRTKQNPTLPCQLSFLRQRDEPTTALVSITVSGPPRGPEQASLIPPA